MLNIKSEKINKLFNQIIETINKKIENIEILTPDTKIEYISEETPPYVTAKAAKYYHLLTKKDMENRLKIFNPPISIENIQEDFLYALFFFDKETLTQYKQLNVVEIELLSKKLIKSGVTFNQIKDQMYALVGISKDLF